MNCERCGRHLDRREGRIGDLDYCHPDDPNLPDCYTITSHEQTFGKVLGTPEEVFAHIDSKTAPALKLLRGTPETLHKMLRMLADPNTTVTYAKGGRAPKETP